MQLAITSSVAKRCAQNIELIVCITIDGDEKNKGDIATAVPFLLRFFDQTHLRGKVTWFLNQYDVNWVERYPDLIMQILDRKDEVGLHSHVEDRIHDYRSLVRIISNAKQRIEEYCAKRLSNNYCIISFRSGKLAKSEELFNAISDAGFKFDSSVRPGWSGNDIHSDDRDVRPLIDPYYVDPIDYKVPSSSPKTILELPVTLDPYSPIVRKGPNQRKVLYVILKHPYAFLGILGLFTRAYIRTLLFFVKRFPNVKFMTIKDAGQHFIENQHR